MRLLVTGATGQIGRRLVVARSCQRQIGRGGLGPPHAPHGDEVVVLSRDGGRARRMFGAGHARGRSAEAELSGESPKATRPTTAGRRGEVEVVEGDVTVAGEWQKRVDGCDAVVHLAGAGIADRRWTAAYKQELIRSRIEGTRQVVNAIGSAKRKPAVLVSGSAMGFYDDAGDEELTEEAGAGRSFLAKMCVAWEAEAARAAKFGVRVVTLRLGIVLDESGGALREMLRPFRWGVGGPLGNGRQWWPWIHWRDVHGIVDLALKENGIAGAVNVVGPQAVRQREFAKTLGRVLRRPAIVPMPGFALKLVMGEVAEYLLMSQRVVPAAAQKAGYEFEFPELESALRNLIV